MSTVSISSRRSEEWARSWSFVRAPARTVPSTRQPSARNSLGHRVAEAARRADDEDALAFRLGRHGGSSFLLRAAPRSLHQRSPRRVAGVARGRHQEFAVAENVGHVDLRAPDSPPGSRKNITNSPLGEKVGPSLWIALGDDALARAVGLHHADAEQAVLLPGEGDEVAARRPDRRRIAPFAERDAVGRAAVALIT